MDTVWLIFGIIFMLVRLAGCILPLLPGPPVSYVGLLMLQLRADPPFALKFMLLWAGIVVAVTALDYVIPLYGTKRFGGTRYGIWGCTIGLVLGLFIPPWGIIIGPFLGAFLGEVLANNNSDKALRAAFGSFIGFLFGTLLKLVTCVVMIYYFVQAI
jgi:uncharacterized protein